MAELSYRRRVIDDDLDELLGVLPAIAIEGPRGVGKTRTALERAGTVFRLDDPAQLEVARADPRRLLEGERPILIDEWQHLPEVWDLVRRAVDAGAEPGSFLLTGSAVTRALPTHSGAGRIVIVRMRPLSFAERLGPGAGSVSVGALLEGSLPGVGGSTEWALAGYVEEILASGLPGIRPLPERARRLQLDGYLARLVDRDLPDDVGLAIRNPVALRRWMAAYAAATSTTATFETIRDAASAGHDRKPSKSATQGYRDALTRLWMVDEVPAWLPSTNRLRELGRVPKHQLADPALAARLLGAEAATLISGSDAIPVVPRQGTLLGALFEHLVALSVQVYAARHDARVGHFRSARGRQEVDLIVERADGAIVAIEVKLVRTPTDNDVRHLRWLSDRLGDQVLDRVVVTTGSEAYRRTDGIAVVPLALLAA